MKIIYTRILVFLLISAFYVGCEKEQKPPESENVYSEVYTNEELGFSIAFPEYWKGYYWGETQYINGAGNSSWVNANIVTEIDNICYIQKHTANSQGDIEINTFYPSDSYHVLVQTDDFAYVLYFYGGICRYIDTGDLIIWNPLSNLEEEKKSTLIKMIMDIKNKNFVFTLLQ